MKKINVFNLVAIIIAALLWIFAPFVYSNFFSLFSLPTAIDTLFHNSYSSLLSAFDIKDAINFCAQIAAGGSGIAIIAAFISTLNRNTTAAKFHCVMGVLSMLPVFFALFFETNGDIFKDFKSFFGLGYCGIILVFALISIVKDPDLYLSNESSEETADSNQSVYYDESLRNKMREEIKNELKEEMNMWMRENERQSEILKNEESARNDLQNKLNSIVLPVADDNKNEESEESSHNASSVTDKNEVSDSSGKSVLCPCCNGKIPADSLFCGYCGNSLS